VKIPFEYIFLFFRSRIFFRSRWLRNRFVKSRLVRFASAPEFGKSMFPISLLNRITQLGRLSIVNQWLREKSRIFSIRRKIKQCDYHYFSPLFLKSFFITILICVCRIAAALASAISRAIKKSLGRDKNPSDCVRAGL